MSLLSELKRRNVLRVAAAYVAVSWLLIQVVETLFPVFGLSDAAIRNVVIILAIGFIPAVIVAWAFELTPEGLVRDSEVDYGSAAVKARTKRLDRIVMVALALAVGFFAFDKFMLDPARDEAIAEAAREEGRAEALQESRDDGPPVVAVLPFSAITATEDSEFFAAGVHDDLLTKLAQLSSMLVISRTSVLEYKDTEENIRTIGAALGADAILEGGVQTAGNRIRINAQLIEAKTDEHLWAETYDRELTAENIFDVQDDIAHAIADALHITFAEPAQGSLIPTSNMAAYRAYHQAVEVREALHGGTTSDEYREFLKKAFELDPGFTRPRVLLIGSYTLELFGSENPELLDETDKLLAELQAIAPNSADYVMAQTYYTYYVLKDYDLALQLADQALEMVPSDAYLQSIRGWIMRRQGNFEGHLESLYVARQIEPRNADWTETIVNNLTRLHRYDEAAAEIDAFEGRNYTIEMFGMLLDVREHGDLERLRDEAMALSDESDDSFRGYDRWYANALVRDFDSMEAALESIPPSRSSRPPSRGLTGKQALSMFTYWAMGDEERLAEIKAIGRENLSRMGTPEELLGKDAVLTMAALAALEGKTEETEELIGHWYRGGAQDLAGRGLNWELACEMLGMAGAAEAAVDCLQTGLEIPSGIMPFIEPYLPMYDPIRDEPVFVEWLDKVTD